MIDIVFAYIVYLLLISYIVVYRVYRSLIEFLSFDNVKLRINNDKVKALISPHRIWAINKGNNDCCEQNKNVGFTTKLYSHNETVFISIYPYIFCVLLGYVRRP